MQLTASLLETFSYLEARYQTAPPRWQRKADGKVSGGATTTTAVTTTYRPPGREALSISAVNQAGLAQGGVRSFFSVRFLSELEGNLIYISNKAFSERSGRERAFRKDDVRLLFSEPSCLRRENER